MAPVDDYLALPAGCLHYLFYPKKDADTLVFIHGYTLDHRMWASQVKCFQDKYQILIYDLLGFGFSDDPSEDKPYTHHEQLYALTQFLGIDHFHCIALSMGGRVALNYVLTYPKTVSKLVFLDVSIAGHAYTELTKAIFIANVDNTKQGGIDFAKEKWAHCPLFVEANKIPPVQQALHLMLQQYRGWHFIHDDQIIPDIYSGTRKHLRCIEHLSLVLVGEYDIKDFHRIASILKKELPNVIHQVIKGAGHLCNMEKSDDVNTLIGRFLDFDYTQTDCVSLPK